MRFVFGIGDQRHQPDPPRMRSASARACIQRKMAGRFGMKHQPGQIGTRARGRVGRLGAVDPADFDQNLSTW